MVFCNLISSEGKKAIYSIGGSPEDLTGRLSIDAEKGIYEAKKYPEKTTVYLSHIGAMIRKHEDEFDKGIFNERLAYQIG